ncbi:hypothetical protein FDO65_11445 [Nakamurella flava]|uniref:Uncharacterized protein n=1 Tax=Nakamurella flava TaxID=2576308 RepID=A0A4U6QG71_9ACTN|nr:hypothetical protein [Nakamurella flava]TKV59233.1 hypothetical protein FDO65_11445 [Nakamurella flava]
MVGRPAPSVGGGGTTAVVQAPAPGFSCPQPGGPVTTERAVYLPTAVFGEGARLGVVGSTVCFDQSPRGGATFSQNASGPVHYFLTTDALQDQIVFGLVDSSVTRVEFVPTDVSAPTRDSAELIEFGADRVFTIPHADEGVVRFYRDSSVVAERTVTPSPEPWDIPQPAPTGQTCDPTAVGALLNTSDIELADSNGGPLFAAVYFEPLNPDQPIDEGARTLCLLVRSTAPAISASAAPLGADQPITYLATTPGNGGTYVWGRMTGDAATISLTDTAGVVTTLPAAQLDAGRSDQTTFVTFIPDTAAPVASVQAVDKDGRALGRPIPPL